MQSPPTPLHPAPNEEVKELPQDVLPDSTMANIDLNPDLEMEYDDSDEKEGANDRDNGHISDKSDALNNASGPSVAINSIGTNGGLEENRNGSNASQQDNNAHDVSDANDRQNFQNGSGATQIEAGTPQNAPSSPHYKLRSSVDQLDHSPITLAQQSKLINYVDAQLLAVQRRFVKSQAEASQQYPLHDLVHDVLSIVDIIWCSVSTHSKLFGQAEYMVKLLGDLEDYLLHYDLEVGYVGLFKFFHTFDQRLSTLIDGYDYDGHVEKLGQTLLVRLVPIVSRIRTLVVTKLGPTREKLARETAEDVSNRDDLDWLELQVGSLLEGVLERIE